ncbi:MAG TPA: leucine-rich repeat protein, partial [Clostridia bacterium]|nr:leucine-rich repeat protein [Clostridia bacterium]
MAIDNDVLGRTDQYEYYNHYFTSIGGIGKRTYTCTDGTLPSGLTLFSGGQLSGNPDIAGNYDFEITVTDSAYSANTSTGSYTLVVDTPSDYEFSNNTITGYTGVGGDITIPSEIHGEAITAIGERAFGDNTSITSVVIPDSVTSIGRYAFLGCTNLSSVAIPDSVTSIGGNVFSRCTVLTSVVLPKNITAVPDYAFYNCFGLESVTIPDGVEGIGYNAFYWCTALERIKLPVNLKSIGSAAFYNCTGFKNIVIPSGVTSIGGSAFQFESGSQMTAAVFSGEAPTVGNQGFYNPAAGFKIYYPAGKADYTNPWNGFPTESYDASGTYSVTYDANGGTGDVPGEAAGLKIGDYIEVEGQGNLTMANGTFTGWNTAADGSGVNYASGDELLLCKGAVTLYAQWNMKYSITIDDKIKNGSISTAGTTVEEGDIIEVTVTPDSGYHLKDESLVYNDGTGDYIINDGLIKKVNAEAPGTMTIAVKPPMPMEDTYFFEMPAANITITAQFESAACTVTFDKNGGSTEASPTTKAVEAGANLGTLPTAPTRSGYTFIGWNTAADGSGTAFTAATAVMGDITVYAQWRAIPSSHDSDHTSSNGGSSNSSSGGGGATTNTNGNTTIPTVTSTTTIATIGANGSAAAAVTVSQVTDAVNKAAAAAAQAGAGTAANVEIKVITPAAAKTVETSIPKAAITGIANSKTNALTVTTPVASITFDKAAISAISKEATDDVKITASKVDSASLTEETKAVVGDRPVYNFSVTSGDKTISQFGGNVTVAVPYTPKPGEDTDSIVIYYINAAGKPEAVSNCKYDPVTGSITFTTNHFSTYAVGYNKVTFKDVPANAAYNKAVSFIAARGISTGTGDGKFSPEAAITRGQFIVMVMKAYGIKPDETSKDNFADAGSTYYTNYLSAAKRLGLTDGTDSNKYMPDREITRQEMISLLYKTLKVIGELPTAEKGKDLTAYTDADQIASWAKDAMRLFAKAEIITGTDNKLTPTEKASRADMTQVLYNLLS